MQKIGLTIACCLFAIASLLAQATSIFTDANLSYKRGVNFYEQGLFGAAQKEFRQTIDNLRQVNETEAALLREKAELYFAQAAVRLERPESEKVILDFIRTYDPTGIASTAKYEIANYYYNAKKYDEAIEFFNLLNVNALPKEQRIEATFKQGYAYFVKKKNGKAKSLFKSIKDQESPYQEASNYYYGMTAFFDKDFKDALQSFEKANASKKYNKVVPYYITQIHFAQKDYDKVISYGKNILDSNNDLRNSKEISQLVGQSYFEKGNYREALPYLEEYANGSNKMREKEIYQLAYTQYQVGKYRDAMKNLEALQDANSELAQNALFTLGDSYLKTGNKASARTAFGKASKMNFDAATTEEALFNYAKLSYELKYHREAVDAIQQIKTNSKYFNEGQVILSNIFLNTRDYANALKVIESMPNKTQKIKETYQQVAYYRGVQLYKEGKMDEANRLFDLSLDNPYDTRIQALANYWLGDIAHHKNQFDQSIAYIDKFFGLAKNASLPDDASIHTANYIQGYNYLKQKNYKKSSNYFAGAVKGIKENLSYISNEDVKKQILPDAILRSGDGFFKQNDYKTALTHYDEVVRKKWAGFDYALYQKAIIQGLKGETVDKIVGLEELAEKYPTSNFADDALYSLGATYFEIGKNDLAIKNLQKLVNNYKKSELLNETLLKLGLIAFNQNENSKALNYYKQVFNNNPDPDEAKEALNNIEEIYVEMGQTDEYFAFLETVPGYGGKVNDIAKDSINFKAAEAQYEGGNYEKAIESYSKYIKNFPKGKSVLKAHYNRGESYFILKKYDDALDNYEYVVSKGNSSYYANSLYKAAEISYNHKSDFKKAYDYYTQLEPIATKEEDRFNAQIGALRSAWRLNKPEAVYSTAEKVVANPRATQSQKANAHFYAGKMAFDEKKLDKSLASFKEVIKLTDTEQAAEARYRIAYIYYQKRDLNTAKQLCQNMQQEVSEEYWLAKSVILLADIYAEQGDLFNAKAMLEGVVEGYSGDQAVLNEAKAKLEKLKAQDSGTNRLKPANPSENELELDKPLDDDNR